MQEREPLLRSDRRRSEQQRKNKRRKKWYIALFLLLLVVGGATLWVTGLYNKLMATFTDTYTSVEPSNLRPEGLETDQNMKKFTILFLGIDTGKDRLSEEGQTEESSRTDAMILANVNMENGRIDLVSIPRDSLTYIESVDYYDKITHAHAFTGTAKASMLAVESLLNVPVDYYVQINFDAFQAVVDQLGGVEIDVKTDIWDYYLTHVEIPAGKQVLNGKQALQYVRARAQDSDMARGQRQMEVIQAIFKKASQLQNITALSGLIDIAGNNMTHNFTNPQINTIMTSLLSTSYKMYRHQIKGYDTYYNGVYYYYPSPTNLFELSTLLNYQLGLEAPTKRKLMNVRYGGYIYPLYKDYYSASTTYSGRELGLYPARLDFVLPAYEYFENLPEKLDGAELSNTLDREEESSQQGTSSSTNR